MMTASITRKSRSAQMRWASILVVFMMLISPTGVFAAPALQEVDPNLVGTWESVASQEGETVTVSLFDDGSVSGLSTYEESDDQILYGGSWEMTGEDTFVLYIETVNGVTTEPTVEFVGLVTRRGLRLPDAPDWGRNGMSLSLIDENPTDFSAVEEPATDEPVDGDLGVAGVYASEEMEDDDGGVATITITLFEDGAMETESTYESDTQSSSNFETGSWIAEEDGSVTITFETVNGEPYDPVVAITFLVDGDHLSAPDLTSFGENGLVVWRLSTAPDETGEITETEEVTSTVESALSPIPGLYTTQPIPNGDGSITGVLLHLDEAGGAQSLVLAFTGEDLPISRTGGWVDNEDGTVTVTFDTQLLFDSANESLDSTALDNEETLDFAFADGLLINPELTFYPAGVTTGESSGADEGVAEQGLGEEVLLEEAATEESVAEEVIGEDASSGADSIVFTSPLEAVLSGTTNVLVLLEDGSASISVTSGELEGTLVELGTWEADEEASTVTLTMSLDSTGQPLAEPSVLVFSFDPDTGVLTPEDYDATRYGSDLILEQVK